MGELAGVYLPIITPFDQGRIDWESYQKLIHYYIGQGISGLIPLGTTGESPTVSLAEYHEVIEKTLEAAGSRVPIFVGVSGNDTAALAAKLAAYNSYPFRGYLVTSPYYNRPSQEGTIEHFKRVCAATDKEVIVYNIPYRTGMNIENTTMLQLAKIKNIVGVKDSSGVVSQSLELINRRPRGFAALTGEDILFLTNLANGGSGGILAAAHVHTRKFVQIFELVRQKNDLAAAVKIWHEIYPLIPLLFKEPNPGPLKYLLGKYGLIKSAELRLPLTGISTDLQSLLSDAASGGNIFP